MTLTIIDTFGFLFRSYYALPPLKASNGTPTGLLTGFMNFILNIGRDFDTDLLLFAIDSKDSFRKELYPDYKVHRDVPDDLTIQLPIAISWIEKMGFSSLSINGFEADDIIASVAKRAKEKGYFVRIVSFDKDLYQLLDENVVIFDPIKKVDITQDDCIKKYGIEAQNFIDYQALVGDSADNVPGVKGIGPKSAKELINQYQTIENIYTNLAKIAQTKKRWATLLRDNKKNAFISKELVTLRDDLEINNIEEFKIPIENPILRLEDELIKYDLRQIIEKVRKIGLSFKTKEPKKVIFNKKLIYSLDDIDKNIFSEDIFAFDTETDELDSYSNIVGFSFATRDIAFYVPIRHKNSKNASIENAKEIIEVLKNKKLIFHNFKYDYVVIKNNFGIELNCFSDTMILAWLIDSSSKVSLSFLSKKYLSHNMIEFSDIVEKNQNFGDIDLKEALEYASEDAFITYKLFLLLDKKIPNDIDKRFEFEFIKVLVNMEKMGIKIDIDYFLNLKKEFEENIEILKKNIFALANEEFNINSTKQLSYILFEKLKYPHSKKTKTGYSTSEEVLLKLKDKEIVNYILEYKEYSKLLSTYIKPFIKKASFNNRIYTTFLHTGTSTGRLSSKDPNLQNIPVRSESGKKIRKGFISEDGFKLVSIDYSQIELRLLAHFSEDSNLINAFLEDKDIHLETAIKIFNDSTKRDIAKSINFGLIYGMGARKLADTLNISNKEAKRYIEEYFKAYPTVKNYLNNIKEEAKKNGFIKTIYNRRRYFNFSSVNKFQLSNYEREAVNSVFQGSAADIIKLAMREINKLDIKMLLQIHDELIFEIEEDNLDIINTIVDIMQNIVVLKVPLKCSVAIGNNWSELK